MTLGINIRNKQEIEAKLNNYALTIYIKSKEDPKVISLDLNEYLHSTLLIKEKADKHILTVKCEEEGLEKEILEFSNKEDAKKAVKVIAKAMFSANNHSGFTALIAPIFKFLLKLCTVIAVIAVIFTIFFGNLFNPTAINPEAIGQNPNIEQGLNNDILPEGTPMPLNEVLK